LKILTFDNPESKEVFWHSSAHLMAHAIEKLFQSAKFGVGPLIEIGSKICWLPKNVEKSLFKARLRLNLKIYCFCDCSKNFKGFLMYLM
jgi:hypothetical protein